MIITSLGMSSICFISLSLIYSPQSQTRMDMAASVKKGKKQETDIPYGEQGSLNDVHYPICMRLAFNKDVSVKSGKCNLDRSQHRFWTTALGFYA